MTSIEWLANEVYQAIDLHSQGKLSPTYCLVKIAEAKDKAKEMHYKELMDNMQKGMELQEKENNRIGFRERNGLLPQQEISDKDILNVAYDKYVIEDEIEAFIQGAEWMQEQLKIKP